MTASARATARLQCSIAVPYYRFPQARNGCAGADIESAGPVRFAEPLRANHHSLRAFIHLDRYAAFGGLLAWTVTAWRIGGHC
jgi:hypothetical protein